ncbi:CarD family transcriptional regulator [Chryseobacterium sp. T16E-39]|uniref:Crp/Fnr family transcriptional regulator n=1 Tax=Chryseobacterium sp. T16E-39 TaxID=2015076 RepID=UPI000B5B38C8|nr:Crp/Fnr family transcriptional regulator [Chryseobacterium sp. T16E-39]ASK32605.1 CarD family transcriptional regulator [Chryseobacterium sp. T16E-39]
MEAIRNYFEQSVSMSDKDWELFASKLKTEKFSKKQFLINANETEHYLSFIEKGTVRFFIPKEIEDFTFSFSFAGEFVSAYDSFLTQKPCSYSIQALEETVLWRIAYEDLNLIYAETEIGNKIGRLASERLYLENFKREISLLTQTAEERYLNLFSEQRHILKQIPLKYIASYIGITPQALSRIRRKIS